MHFKNYIREANSILLTLYSQMQFKNPIKGAASYLNSFIIFTKAIYEWYKGNNSNLINLLYLQMQFKNTIQEKQLHI